MSDGTFRPSGVTPWSFYNTPRIWAMVEGEDDPESWRQVAALGSMAGLLKDQRARLEAAKQKLIDAWPPEQNKAARAFVDEIDGLLFNMQVNKDIADSNAGALGRILEALRQAKDKVAPLYQSYLDKSDDWVPGWWDHAEEDLDEKARQCMREADALVADPANALTAPAVYELQPAESRTRPGDESGNGGSPARGGAESPANVAVLHEPPPPLPSQESIVSGVPIADSAAGPDLAGVITPGPGGPAGPPPNVAVSPAGVAASPGQPGVIIGGGIPGAISGRAIGGPGSGRSPSGGIGGQRGLPNGALIGYGNPGAGAPGPVKPSPPAWLPQAPAPAGRGGSGAGGRSAHPAALPMGVGRPPARSEAKAGVAFEPDNPWATAVGVPPVIEPDRKRYRHDPGPGVIGLRR